MHIAMTLRPLSNGLQMCRPFGGILPLVFLFWIAVSVGAQPAAPLRAGAAANPGDHASYVLEGRVVTMNASFSIIDNGFVGIDKGVIFAVANSRKALEQAATDAKIDLQKMPVVQVNGDIYPGLIDLHNHPEYAIYPLLPVTRKYKDRYEWRFYDDDYQRRITHLNTLMTQPQYFDLAIEVGRYGEYKALVGGTTSIQGGRVSLAYAREECLVRNIETSPVTPRTAFSRVDIGRDADEWRRMADEKSRGPMAIHLAEGVGPRMANEFEALKRSGLVGAGLIAIHGVGLNETQLKEMAATGAKLVWSPLSNFMLYGQTANIVAARRAGVEISLAPDWAPSGSKSLLGELKVADLVNRHQFDGLFSDRELVEMVTVNPASAMGWQGKLGRIAPGYLADLVVLDRVADDAYRNLIGATEENVKLVVVRGSSLYGDKAIISVLRAANSFESLAPIRGSAGRQKVIAANCPGTDLPPMSVEDIQTRLQRGLELDPGYVSKRITIEQFTRDFAICNAGKPNDPPTAGDAGKLLACRFQLPFEKTELSPLVTADDAGFFPRLLANPNLPGYLRALPDYYRIR